MWVIKIGGSLATAAALPAWLARIEGDRVRRWVIVPGGGPYAEAVRGMQARWGFDDRAAHGMALRAMALYAAQLKAMLPSLPAHEGQADLASVQATTVWSPDLQLAAQLDGLPEDWRLSSDSIALWLAQRLGADGLVLLKFASPPRAGNASVLSADGYVDACFPALLRECALPVYWQSVLEEGLLPVAGCDRQRILIG